MRRLIVLLGLLACGCDDTPFLDDADGGPDAGLPDQVGFGFDFDGLGFGPADVSGSSLGDGGLLSLPAPALPDAIDLGRPELLDVPIGRTWDVESALRFRLLATDRAYAVRVLAPTPPVLHIESPHTEQPLTVGRGGELRIVGRLTPTLETQGSTLSIERDQGLPPLKLRIHGDVTQNPLAPGLFEESAATANCRQPECWPVTFGAENVVVQGVQVNFAEIIGTDVRPIRTEGSLFVGARQISPLVTVGLVPQLDQASWATFRIHLERPDHTMATSSIPILYIAHRFSAPGAETFTIENPGLPSRPAKITVLGGGLFSGELGASSYDPGAHRARVDLNLQWDPSRSMFAAVLDTGDTWTLILVFNLP
ncbi:MAG: hypothetical protein U1E65_07625 [Myxococcota bacterium]